MVQPEHNVPVTTRVLAGELLTKTRQNQLARDYRAEHAKRGPYTI